MAKKKEVLTLAGLKKEIDKLEERVKYTEDFAEQIQTNSGEIDKLSRWNGKLENDILELRSDVNWLDHMKGELRDELLKIAERIEQLEQKDDKIIRELSRINGDISKLKPDAVWNLPYEHGEQLEQTKKQEDLIKKAYQEGYEEYIKTFPVSGVGIERIDNTLYVNKTFLNRNKWIEFDVPAGVDTFIIKVVE